MEKKNVISNHLDKQYIEMLFNIMHNGREKETRSGKTKSKFGYQIRHKMSEGFPLLTTKKMYWKGIVTELLWFLRGDTNIKYLVDNNCHIWDGDAYKKYLNETQHEAAYTKEEFINLIKTDHDWAKVWGDLGPVYGKQWRSWETYEFSVDNDFGNNEFGGGWNVKQMDQIANLINDLKTNPDSRRLMVSAWNVGEMDQMTLPPCHTDFQFYTRELSLEERQELQTKMFNGLHYLHYSLDGEEGFHKEYDKQNVPRRAISLMWNQRSVDVPLGLPFNIASYGLLLEIIAKMTNMVPDELIGNLGDCHIYENQLEGCREQITRESFVLPKLRINTEFWATSDDVIEYTLDTEILSILIEDFQIEGYESHPAIKIPLSN